MALRRDGKLYHSVFLSQTEHICSGKLFHCLFKSLIPAVQALSISHHSCFLPWTIFWIMDFPFISIEGLACGGIFCCFYHDFFSLWLFHGFQDLGSEEGLLSTDLTCSFSSFSPQTLQNGKASTSVPSSFFIS